MSDFDVNHKVPREGYGQYWATTCWHSSYRMLYAWQGLDPGGIDAKLVKAKLVLKDLRARGLYPEEFPTAGSALGLCGWRGDYIRELDDGMLAHILKGYGPLWIATNWRGEEGAGHAVVIVGYDRQSKLFKVHNPYNRFDPGNVEMDWLRGRDLRQWIIRRRWALQAWP